MIEAKMHVEYVDHMGSDLDVVDAARVSFAKESEWEWDNAGDQAVLSQADTKLIKYLAKHNHWSPFAHCSAKFRVKAPIFVARQLVKHTVGFSWNEVSRRYVDSNPEFYFPEYWRKSAENVKQGSSSEPADTANNMIRDYVGKQLALYQMMLADGVCAEQARMVLPQNTMTEWIWTGTLYAWARMCQLRLDKHTQSETREIAKAIDANMKALFPVSWAALMHDEKKEKVCALLS